VPDWRWRRLPRAAETAVVPAAPEPGRLVDDP
jgi:hypothetical protein